MPELPEVETTCRGIVPHIGQQIISQVIIRNHQLRWPISASLVNELPRQKVTSVSRRGKYILLHCTQGTLIIHLGMSGSLRILEKDTPVNKHDHVDILFANKLSLRFTDPRRFGCLLWTSTDYQQHILLAKLGPEPLTRKFTGKYLYEISRTRHVPVKTFIMDGRVVVGVGNIYANEALFLAGINPKRTVKRLKLENYQKLATAIKRVLNQAIKQGGTTLRNFTGSDGKPGYFKQRLQVYGRGNLNCVKCKQLLKEIRLGQRSTIYCPSCQR